MAVSNVGLALRLLHRDWRGGQLRVLAFALLVAVAATTTITCFTERLGKAVTVRSAELIGGDLVISGTRPLKPEWLQAPAAAGLDVAQITEFASVVRHEADLLLTSIKAVSANYPLYGRLQVSATPQGRIEYTTHSPEPGQAWLDRRVMERLNLRRGDTITVGAADFIVTRVLQGEPDRGRRFISLAPRILINSTDLPRTQVLQPGSRADYRYLFKGEVGELRDWLAPQMQVGYRLVEAGSPRSGSADFVVRAQQYLKLVAVMAIVLSAIAITLAAHRYARRHFDVSALLRCLGVTPGRIVKLYLLQLGLLALAIGGLGIALGWAAQALLAAALVDTLALSLPAPGWRPLWISLAVGGVMLLGTALPALLRLGKVSPMRVLRRELAPAPFKVRSVYAAALLALGLVTWLLTQALLLILLVVLGLFGLAALWRMLAGVLALGSRIDGDFGYSAAGQGLRRLARRRSDSTLQITAFGVTLMLMLTVAMLRNELLTHWGHELPDNAPNHFVFNILPADQPRLRAFLQAQGIAEARLYPMVRGRLVAINGEPVGGEAGGARETGQARDDEALQRELNLSWTRQLPANNELLAGRWWDDKQHDPPAISIEAGLAERLNIGLEDRLSFNIAGQLLTGRVSSVRRVEWAALTPNFYFFFEPGVLEAYPATLITSFYLQPDRSGWLAELVQKFPSVTVLELDALVRQLQDILRQMGMVVELMLVFVLLAGFAVLLACTQSSLDERLQEGALLRVLGADSRRLRTMTAAEFAWMGLIAGLLAVAGAELLSFYLYREVFDLSPRWHVLYWLWTPFLCAAVIALAGLWATREARQRSPLAVLRRFE